MANRWAQTHETATTLKAFHAAQIIEQAFAKLGIPEIGHTDPGSQFTVDELARVVLALEEKLSFDGRVA